MNRTSTDNSMVSLAKSILSGLGERFTTEDVSPERLACLFMIDPMVRPYFPAFRQAIAERLLHYTISSALASSPWYKEAYSRQGIGADHSFTLNDLRDLPVIDRNILEQEGHLLRSSTLNFGSASFTSGTTSFCPLVIDNSAEEHRFVRDFFRTMQQGRQHIERIGLNLTNTYHGQLVEIPTAFRRVNVSANTMSGLRTAQTLLMRTYTTASGPQSVSAIGGPLIALLRLTAFLEAEQDRNSLPEMDFIQSTSEYLTPHALSVLQTYWDCPVEDRYGLSEIIIGAWRCRHCGHYHFEPYGIAEVVGMDNSLPVTSGRGRLVLTGFAPFMQMTPLIRYLTGDGIEIVATPCETGETGFRLLGRLRNSLVLEGKLVLGEYEAMDILDDEPDVFRRKMYRYLPAYLQEVGSPPQFELVVDPDGTPAMTIWLSYDPLEFPAKVESLQQRIAKALAAKGLFSVRLRFSQGIDEAVMF